MKHILEVSEWQTLSHLLGATSGDTRALRAAQACLFRYSVQMAKRYRTFDWHALPAELGVTGVTANRRFLCWCKSGQWFGFWDALIELRYGRATPEKPHKNIDQCNPLQALILELERAYRFFNHRFTGNQLPTNVVISVEAKGRYGGYLSPHFWRVGFNPEIQHHLVVSASAIRHGSSERALEVLLHEMAHLSNVAVGVSDTDPITQYHRQDFRDTALLFGLACGERKAKTGYGSTTLADRGAKAITLLQPVEKVFQWCGDFPTPLNV
jgi:hypothetical protein